MERTLGDIPSSLKSMIEVFDDVLMEDTREALYMFSSSTDYQIGWGDVSTFETRQYPCLHHTMTDKEWETSKFIPSICSCLLYTSDAADE